MSEKTIKKIIPIQDFASPYLCVWLQEMSEQGLVLKKLGNIFAEFEKSTPMKRRYRTIFASTYTMDEAEKAIYEESGWQLIYASNDVTIAMTSDENAPEPFTDTESYLKHKHHKWFLYLIAILGGLFLLVYMVRRLMESSVISDAEYIKLAGQLHGTSDQPDLIPITIVVMIFLFGVLGIQAIERCRTLGFLLGKKIPDYNISYKDKGYTVSKVLDYIQRISCYGLVIMLFVVTVFGLNSDMGHIKMLDGNDALKYDGEHPVRLSEIDPESWQMMEPYIIDRDANSDISADYMVCFEKNRYIKNGRREQLNVSRAIDSENDIYESTIHYYSFYGEATSEDVAMQWLGEEATYNIHGKVQGFDTAKILDEIIIDCEGVDYAGYATTPRRDVDKYDLQCLYLRKGKAIQIITYSGPIELRSKIEVFTNEFE